MTEPRRVVGLDALLAAIAADEGGTDLPRRLAPQLAVSRATVYRLLVDARDAGFVVPCPRCHQECPDCQGTRIQLTWRPPT